VRLGVANKRGNNNNVRALPATPKQQTKGENIVKNNKHSQSIPADILEQAKAKITEAADLLKPYLLALTPAEKQEIPKM
jgi:hypothetical protein